MQECAWQGVGAATGYIAGCKPAFIQGLKFTVNAYQPGSAEAL